MASTATWFWAIHSRDDMPSFGVLTRLTHSHFVDFEKAFGKKPDVTSKRTDQGEEGRSATPTATC